MKDYFNSNHMDKINDNNSSNFCIELIHNYFITIRLYKGALTMNMENLNSFLQLGYFLDYKSPRYQLNYENIDKNKYEKHTEEELIKLGIDLFNNAISKQFSSRSQNVVPLSGGLDSRAILGSLLKHTESHNIKTYTFGSPGTFDYEIGNKLAKKFGTKHLAINLNETKYKMDDLIEMSKRVNQQTVLFHHPPVSILDNYIEDSVVWSGAIIDVFFGRHKHKIKSNNELEAKRNFIRENTYQNQIHLSNPERSIIKNIDFNEEIADEIGLEHYLDLENRQLKFISPHVLASGYKYNILFEDRELVNFALNLPDKYIEDQYLYKKMFLYGFPDLFKIPNKTTYGLPLNSNELFIQLKKNIIRGKLLINNRIYKMFKNPFLNYIDFESEIRNREDLRNIVYSNIMDLKARKIIDWIDIEKVWSDYFNLKKRYANALLILTSLEIHLKTRN